MNEVETRAEYIDAASGFTNRDLRSHRVKCLSLSLNALIIRLASTETTGISLVRVSALCERGCRKAGFGTTSATAKAEVPRLHA
jgi:hypothetical protein